VSEEQASGRPPTAAIERAAITFRWDLDKTYLRTQFESLRQMVKIPFEAGSDKVHLPGVPPLIQALRRCAVARAQRPFVFFLSASPARVIAEIPVARPREKRTAEELAALRAEIARQLKQA